MKILSHLSAGEIEALRKSDRVALVLMGGGAKGAYHLGVWKVLWKLGVRQFSTITGTSVGALNAFLFANGDPEFAEKTWDEVILAGVLERKRSLLGGILAIIFAHLLIFLSVVIAFLLLLSEVAVLIVLLVTKLHGGAGVWDNAGLFFGCASLCLMFCWFTARIDSSFLNWLATGGYALPLFAEHPARRARFIDVVCGFGYLPVLGWLWAKGFPSRHLPGLVMWLAVPAWFVLIVLRHQGLQLLHETVRVHPLFEREALNATMVKLTAQNKLFSNCSGPVMATLARHAVYHDPFKVHPLDQRYRYDGIIEEYVLSPDWTRQWRNAEPLAEWVPEYIDLAKAPDPAWVLSATSAIPFAWKALTLPRPDVFGPERNDVFVDGGLVDNFPLLPAAAAKPEFIIAVALNAFDTLGDDLSLRRTIQENWRRSFFSKRENDDVADNMRDKWIKSLPPGYFAEREARAKALAQYAPSFFSKFVSMSPGPFPSLPPVGPDLEDTKVIFLRPSKATSINLPILGLITGTIRFDRSYKKKLVAMGIKDAEMLFAPTLAETSSRD